MTSTARARSARRRLFAACAAAATVAAGLMVYSAGVGVAGDIAGDALYAALIYLLLVTALPRASRRVLAAIGIIFCTAVEMLQLTDWPATISAAFPPAELVLGASFDRRDLVVYALAVIATMIVDAALSRAIGRRSHPQTR